MDCYKETPEIHLLNVQLPFDGNVSFFILATPSLGEFISGVMLFEETHSQNAD